MSINPYPYIEQSIKDRQRRALYSALRKAAMRGLLAVAACAAVLSAYSCVGG